MPFDTLPNGAPLPASLRKLIAEEPAWLAALGWFTLDPFTWTPRTLAQIVAAELGEPGDAFEISTMQTCFLLPGGTESRRVYVITNEPDSTGEYPIVLVDIDDVPFLCVYMAGLDVFLAERAGTITMPKGGTYEDVSRDERFRARMSHHGKKLMKGRISTDFPRDTLTPRPARSAKNPFSGATLKLRAIPAGEVAIDWDRTDDD